MNAAQRLILLAPDRLTLVSQQAANLSDAYWGKARVTIAENYGDPDGGTTAESVLETAVTNTFNVGLASQIAVTPGTFELQTVVKSVGGRWADVTVWDSGFVNSVRSIFDPGAGALGNSSSDNVSLMRVISHSIAPFGSSNSYFLHKLRFYTTYSALFFYLNLRSDAGTTNYLGDIAKGVGVARFGLYSVR